MIKKSELFISSYKNKKGVQKISMNLTQSFARKLMEQDKGVLDAVTSELKEYFQENATDRL